MHHYKSTIIVQESKINMFKRNIQIQLKIRKILNELLPAENKISETTNQQLQNNNNYYYISLHIF